MSIKLTYAMKFVANMDAAVKFHRDVLGFPLKFQSPGWSELVSGETTIALHQADTDHPAGMVRIGILLAEFVDPDGAFVSISEAR